MLVEKWPADPEGHRRGLAPERGATATTPKLSSPSPSPEVLPPPLLSQAATSSFSWGSCLTLKRENPDIPSVAL